jgi:hypothetical protein
VRLPLALAPMVFLSQVYWPPAKALAVSKLPPAAIKLAMETGLLILKGVELDDAAHLAAVLGGNAGGVDAHGLDVVGFNLGAEAGGAVVGERDAIDDELGLILRAARVQNGVAFVEPAGLRVHEVLQDRPGMELRRC